MAGTHLLLYKQHKLVLTEVKAELHLNFLNCKKNLLDQFFSKFCIMLIKSGKNDVMPSMNGKCFTQFLGASRGRTDYLAEVAQLYRLCLKHWYH